MRRAQAASSELASGLHTNSAADGGSARSAPTLYGPSTLSVCTCGAPSAANGLLKSRRNGCSRVVSSVQGALLEKRRGHRPRAGFDVNADVQPRRLDLVRRRRRILLQLDEVLVAADRREQNPLAVERDLHLMRILQSAHRAQVRPPQPQLKLVVAVDRKRVRRDAARPACRAAALRDADPARDPAARSTCRD